jgi:hypothetical protein
MSRLRNRELTSKDALAHPVDEGEGSMLAAFAEQFGKRGRQRRVGDDLSLNASGKTFCPSLAMALHCSQTLLFADQCVDFARIVLNTQSRTLSLIRTTCPSGWGKLIQIFNVPLRF